ncbi:MAG: HisA/HisF-related TIM barrel protein [Chthoniobacterales bacterium]
MYSPRIIATLVIRNGHHVQSLGFKHYLPVGSPAESAREYDRWGVDEIVLILTNDSGENARHIISSVADAIAVPLTVAGGIRTLWDAHNYLSWGADKVALNHVLVEQPDIATAVAHQFGSQCLVASVDVWRTGNKLFRYDHWLHSASSVELLDWIHQKIGAGAGEILLNFPQHDGMRIGMDSEAISQVVQDVGAPVIACGGIGTVQHAVDCLRTANPSGIAIGNVLAHFEQSILLFKEGIKTAGAEIRAAVKATYNSHRFDPRGCPEKLDDAKLDELLFHRIEPELI